ncbi:MAG: NAD-dependent epimerase/dehydratase family protein [Candidatus Obscuribacterales bacterium]|nr:NAD-dependent epimerase/dehydratase family protein [Candidatus Obscuribacterales bacterium]
MLDKIVQEDLDYIVSSPLPWHTLAGKTGLVSGANGHLASYMIETLLHLNDKFPSNQPVKVIALVRNEERTREKFAHRMGRDDLQIVVRDFQQPIVIDQPVNFVVHAASTASSVKNNRVPEDLYGANVLATFHLLELARLHKVDHFLYFSSGEVYGKLRPEQIPVKEDCYGAIDPTRIRSCYAECKKIAENMCACWFHQYGVPAKIVRPCHTFGPGLSLVDGPIFADLLNDLLNRRPLKLKSDGKALRTFCYLADATLAYYWVMFNGQQGEPYNVANDKATTTISDLADSLASAFDTTVDRPPPATSPPVEIWPDGTPDTTKLKSLGWSAKTSLVDAFRRTLTSLETAKSCES